MTPHFLQHSADGIQADVALLQYPLRFNMSSALARNDLNYYAAVTRADGYFTGDSAYSIAWLRLGNRSAADEQFQLAFLHQDIGYVTVIQVARRHTTHGPKTG